MKKPKPQTKSFYDYHQCAKYVAHVLGVKDLRDYAGRWSDGHKEDREYQDFWHFLLDHVEISNGCMIQIPTYLLDYNEFDELKDWQVKILKVFRDKFGDDAEYWVV